MKTNPKLMVTYATLVAILAFLPRGITGDDPEASMNITQTIQYHGYPVEEYKVKTRDTYLLGLFRIPHGKNNTDYKGPRKPVLIQHGFVSDASIWTADPPYKNLPYVLAEKNYDIWLGNFRGSAYSREHETLSPNQDEFWDFSFDELAQIDLPDMIDFILNKTGFEQLHYIGHSMGSAAGFALLSTAADYNTKIRSMNALSPLAHLHHTKSPLIKALATFSNGGKLLRAVGGYELEADSPLYDFITTTACAVSVTESLCGISIFTMFGYDNDQLNRTRIPVYTHVYPSPTSTKTGDHLGQLYNARKFQHYDYGREGNKAKYNQTTPPLYDVTKITAPTALYWGENDWLAVPIDLQFLIDNVKSIKLNYRVPFDKFNNIDFHWALQVVPLVYDKLAESLNDTWQD